MKTYFTNRNNTCAAFIMIFLLVIASLIALKIGHKHEVFPIEYDLTKAYGFNQAQYYEEIDGTIFINQIEGHESGFRLPISSSDKYKKIRITFSDTPDASLENIRYLRIIYEDSATREKVVGDRFVRIVKPNRTYEMPTHFRNFDSIAVIIITNGEKVKNSISKLELIVESSHDFEFMPYLIALLIGGILLLPGVLLASLVPTKYSDVFRLNTFFAFGIIFYFLLFTILFLTNQFSAFSNQFTVGLSFCVMLLALLFLNYRANSFQQCLDFIHENRLILVLYLLLLLGFTYYVCYDIYYPYQNMTWKSISGYKTFAAFNAHDNYFQYANGRVLQEGLDFSVEYGSKSDNQRPLFFYPQDRSILPGVIYSVFRSLLSVYDMKIVYSFLTYTSLGMAMNLMILFPLVSLCKRYLSTIPILVLLVVFGSSTLFISMVTITWFKLAGAALFISALILLLQRNYEISHWVWAGILLALATSMHPGAALGIPFYFLWFSYDCIKSNRFSIRFIVLPMLLVFCFIMVNAPWNVVKSLYFEPSISLPSSFLLGGYSENNNLIDSAKLFFKEIPLNEQLAFRLDRIKLSFRIDELKLMIDVYQNYGWKALSGVWNKYHFAYSMIFFYPLLILLVLSLFVSKFNKSAKLQQGLDRIKVHELSLMILIGFATFFSIVFFSYSQKNPADISWGQPTGVLVVIQVGLIVLLLKNRIGMTLLAIYTAVSISSIIQKFV